MESKDPHSATMSASLDSPTLSMIPDRSQLDWDDYLARLEDLLSKHCIFSKITNCGQQRDCQTIKIAKTQLKIDDPEILHDIKSSTYHLNVTKQFMEAFKAICDRKSSSAATGQERPLTNEADDKGDQMAEGAEGESFRPVLRSAVVNVMPVPLPIIQFNTNVYRYQLKKMRRYYEALRMEKHQAGIDMLLRLLDDASYLSSTFDNLTKKPCRLKEIVKAESKTQGDKLVNDLKSGFDVDANENKQQLENATESPYETDYNIVEANDSRFEEGNFTADEIDKLASDLANKNQIFQNGSRKMQIFAGLLSGPSKFIKSV